MNPPSDTISPPKPTTTTPLLPTDDLAILPRRQRFEHPNPHHSPTIHVVQIIFWVTVWALCFALSVEVIPPQTPRRYVYLDYGIFSGGGLILLILLVRRAIKAIAVRRKHQASKLAEEKDYLCVLPCHRPHVVTPTLPEIAAGSPFSKWFPALREKWDRPGVHWELGVTPKTERGPWSTDGSPPYREKEAISPQTY